MFWALLVAVGVLLLVSLAFDVTARRKGTYRGARHFREASKQRRAQRVNVVHMLYERRTGHRHSPSRRR